MKQNFSISIRSKQTKIGGKRRIVTSDIYTIYGPLYMNMDCAIISNVFCYYYLQCFHLWFPCHKSGAQFLTMIHTSVCGSMRGMCTLLTRHMTCPRCLLLYVLATSKVISERVTTGDSAHSSRLYSAAQLGNQAVSSMTL